LHEIALSLYCKKIIMGSFKDLKVYSLAFGLAMEIFEISRSFPKEETFSLTDQIRRSSRSICTNLAEGYRKRLYPAHFVNKLTDSDAENSETEVWLDFAVECKYIDTEKYQTLIRKSLEVGKLLGIMIKNPGRFT
jgi:four helix bundle protein